MRMYPRPFGRKGKKEIESRAPSRKISKAEKIAEGADSILGGKKDLRPGRTGCSKRGTGSRRTIQQRRRGETGMQCRSGWGANRVAQSLLPD